MTIRFAQNARRGLAAQRGLDPIGNRFVFVAPVERSSERSRAQPPLM
jgi:hypothetical protein